MMPIETILFAGDLSAQSACAFQFALGLARDYRARLKVVHVATPPLLVTQQELQRALESTDGYRAELEALVRQTYAVDSSPSVEYLVLEGDPAVELLQAASDLQCTLIVMGTHGRSGLSRVMLGSVAERLIRKAECPVLTVKSQVAKESVTEPASSEFCVEPVGP